MGIAARRLTKRCAHGQIALARITALILYEDRIAGVAAGEVSLVGRVSILEREYTSQPDAAGGRGAEQPVSALTRVRNRWGEHLMQQY